MWYSSYEENNYGDLFYSIVRLYKPKKIVELGTLAGYSAYYMAKALKVNGKGTIDCFDLWENYSERLGPTEITYDLALANLKNYKDIITLNQTDAYSIYSKYNQVDILHIDLDNNATVLEKTVPFWLDKVTKLIIVEGGSEERDQMAAKSNTKKMSVEHWLDSSGNKGDLLKEVAVLFNQNQFVKIEGNDYKEKPMMPWLKSFAEKHKLEYFTFEPFPSVTLISKK